MDIGMPELLVILIIIILVFGVGRVGKLGGELGKGIRSFREGLNGTDVDKTQPESNPETKNADKHEEI